MTSTTNGLHEIEKIRRMANPHWIKYIQCKKCKLEYETEIATEPCIKCGGYDFEQFDLILYPMPKGDSRQHE